ncbi:MAG: sigma-70 family RNA polymerase sigma factor [Clostridiaceae bacterium]|nr:sigma-70 family RNA polymerase sigma factor [Clostridiaceae bacterium]
MIDTEKFKRAKEGDLKAIEQICTETWESLYRFVYYKVQNREEAEDITQESYIKTFKYMKENKVPEENFLGFMKMVSLNIIRDRWRKQKRRGVALDIKEINLESITSMDQQNIVAQRLLIKAALEKLNEDQRAVLDLRIIKGYSVAETAKLIGKTEAAVRTSQYRALQTLSKLLETNLLEGI